MTQPCKYFKHCGGYAYSRHAKLCPRCWKMYLETVRLRYPLKNIKLEGKLIHFEFEDLTVLADERRDER